jgi:hypothetical protein
MYRRAFRPFAAFCARYVEMEMVAREPSVMSLDWLLDTPTFRAVGWVECPDNQRLIFVRLDRDEEDVNRFRGRDVVIDGARYCCVDVRTFAPGPYRRGDSVGIIVASVQPAASSSE